MSGASDVRIAIEQPTDADLDVIHATLAATYWSPGVPRDVVARGCANALCAIARDGSGAVAGFARVISDRASFAWLCDVFVLPHAQGRGVARGLVRALRAHPELQGLRRWLLATRDPALAAAWGGLILPLFMLFARRQQELGLRQRRA